MGLGGLVGQRLMVDWIHEYTKERVRKRNLASRPGVLNRIKFVVDASQEWIILTCTGTHLIPDPPISLFKYPFQFHPRVEFFSVKYVWNLSSYTLCLCL